MDNIDDQVRTPHALSYSDMIKVAVPTGSLNYARNIPSNGGTFSPDQIINIPMNVAVNSFVDTKRAYISYKVNNTGTTDHLFIDRCGASVFFDSMRVTGPTGNEISNCQHYNALCAILADYAPADHTATTLNISGGAAAAPVSTVPSVGAVTDLAATGGRTYIEKGENKTFSHVPQIGFFNTDKYLPLGFLNGQCTVSITLASLNTGALTNKDKTTTWTISNVELHLPVIRVSEEFASNFRSLMASGINVSAHCNDVSNNTSTVSKSATGQQDIIIANRKRSVKALLAMSRLSDGITKTEVESVSARRSLGISQYQWNVAGVSIPAAPVNGDNTATSANYGQYLLETQRAMGHLGSTVHSLATGTAEYMKATDSTTASKIVYGLDLEAYSGALSGVNLGSALPLVWQPHIGSSTESATTTGACTIDVFSYYDSMIVLDGVTGTLTANN